jgi:NADPH:quinone reductase
MRRVVIDGYGPPDVMKITECADPEPGDNQVLVRVSAAGVNFIDLYQRTGAYTVQFPWTPGIEGSGVVLRVGTAVSGVADGDRVAWAGCPGSYASHCLVPAERLVPVPDAISLRDAATGLVQGMTAHFLASDVVPLDETKTCLVHAAAGGVGGLLCQIAGLRGATVIGTVSHPAKEQAARAAGATHVIVYSRNHFADQVMDLTSGRGTDVVYDAVGRDTFAEGLACLRPRGTFVLYGQTSGPVEAVDPQELGRRGSLFLTKASLSHYDRTRADLLRRASEVLRLVLNGSLRLRLHGEYPLEDAPAAHEALESRTVTGKVLLRP